MEPYAPCWCQSGKKWKFCHRDREKQPQQKPHEIVTKLRDRFVRGYCSHPEASAESCGERIVRAHTVQRRGGLAAIAENGHVISAKAAAEDIFKNQGEFIPREVGVGSASTFPGFCNVHDSEMFRPVETGEFALTAATAFLLSFRALAYELLLKRLSLATMDREAASGAPFEIQCAIQNFMHNHIAGLKRGVADMERWKSAYDTIYLTKDYSSYRFYAVAFKELLPMVACGSFHPEFDFEGNPLQRIARGKDHQHIAANVTAIQGRTIAALGWNEGEDGPADKFGRSFAEVPNENKGEAARRLLFEHLENIYFTPSWWHGLADGLRKAAIDRIRSGLPSGPERQASCLMDDGLNYFGVVSIETVTTTL